MKRLFLSILFILTLTFTQAWSQAVEYEPPLSPDAEYAFVISNVNNVSNDYETANIDIRAGEKNTFMLYITTNTAGGGKALVTSGSYEVAIMIGDLRVESETSISPKQGGFLVSMKPIEYLKGTAEIVLFRESRAQQRGRYVKRYKYVNSKKNCAFLEPAIKEIVLEGIQTNTLELDYMFHTLFFQGINTLNQQVPLDTNDVSLIKLKVTSDIDRLIWVVQRTNTNTLGTYTLDLDPGFYLNNPMNDMGEQKYPSGGIEEAVGFMITEKKQDFIKDRTMKISVILQNETKTDTNVLLKGTHYIRVRNPAMEIKLFPNSVGTIRLSVISAGDLEVRNAQYTIRVVEPVFPEDDGMMMGEEGGFEYVEDGMEGVEFVPEGMEGVEEMTGEEAGVVEEGYVDEGAEETVEEFAVAEPVNVRIELNGKSREEVIEHVLNDPSFIDQAKAASASAPEGVVFVPIVLTEENGKHFYAYIVKEHDTLTGLADLFWADATKWKRFLEYNEIQVYTPKRDKSRKPYYLLKVGSTLKVLIPADMIQG